MAPALKRLARSARAHRAELLMFTIGGVLFAAGLVSVLFRSGRVPPPPPGAPDVAQTSSKIEVGPPGDLSGPSLAAYVDQRRDHLRRLAATSPRQPAGAASSFSQYMTAAEVEALMEGRRIEVLAVQARIPLDTFDPVQIDLTGRSIAEAVEQYRQETSAQLADELEELERIIPTVTDESFRRVYEEDAELRRRAIEVLEGDPAVLFGAVVRGTLANLQALAGDEMVRLVDVSEDPDAGLQTHHFRAILPEK